MPTISQLIRHGRKRTTAKSKSQGLRFDMERSK